MLIPKINEVNFPIRNVNAAEPNPANTISKYFSFNTYFSYSSHYETHCSEQ